MAAGNQVISAAPTSAHAPARKDAAVKQVREQPASSFLLNPSAHVLPPVHDLGRIGVQGRGLLPLQAKLTINAPDDSYEQEADQVAGKVMRMPEAAVQRSCACGGTCPDCSGSSGHGGAGHSGTGQLVTDHLQTKPAVTPAAGNISGVKAPDIVHEVLNTSGQPLDRSTRDFMEPRFGHDFSRVRVHHGPQAAESAKAVQAKAYTVGRDIVFGEGQYATGTMEGKNLLAHELVHVAQQGGTRSALMRQDTGHGGAGSGGGGGRGAERHTALTVEEQFNFLFNQVGFTHAPSGAPRVDPGGTGAGVGPAAAPGFEVFSAIQVVDASGRQVHLGLGAYLGGGGPHGEEQSLSALRAALPRDGSLRGGRLITTVTQNPCGPARHDCALHLEEFAREYGLTSEVYVPDRDSMTRPGSGVSPSTATRGAQRTDRPPIRYRRLGGGGSSGGTPPATAAPGRAPSGRGATAGPEPTPTHAESERPAPTAAETAAPTASGRAAAPSAPATAEGAAPTARAATPTEATATPPRPAAPAETAAPPARAAAPPARAATPSGSATGSPTTGSPPTGGTAASSESGIRAEVGVPDMRDIPVGGPSPRGEAAAAGITVALMGANFILNVINDEVQRRRVAAELARVEPQITAQRRDHPESGVLVLFFYSQVQASPDSIIQPGAVFESIEYYTGQTRDEAWLTYSRAPAIRQGHSRATDVQVQEQWFAPSRPPSIADIHTPFPGAAEGTFAGARAIFQDVDWGGIGGFDDEGTSDAAIPDSSNPRFVIMRAPRNITFFNGGMPVDVSIPVEQRAAAMGGAIPVVNLDPVIPFYNVAAACVFPANDATAAIFRSVRATHDDGRQLRSFPNFNLVRWIRPENISVLSRI